MKRTEEGTWEEMEASIEDDDSLAGSSSILSLSDLVSSDEEDIPHSQEDAPEVLQVLATLTW